MLKYGFTRYYNSEHGVGVLKYAKEENGYAFVEGRVKTATKNPWVKLEDLYETAAAAKDKPIATFFVKNPGRGSDLSPGM